MNISKVLRDVDAMMSEVHATAARVSNSLHDEHERRAKYFKKGKIHKYFSKDTFWLQCHHNDLLTRHGQQLWYILGVIACKIGRGVYDVQVRDNKVLDWDRTQLQPPAPAPSEEAMTFDFTGGDPDSADGL